MSQWHHVLTLEEIAALHDLTASIDVAFATREQKFWRSRTATQLSVLVAQAWNANDPTGYQMARSYLARL